MTDLSCEALATKEEVQELRDQLNSLLGQTEEGTQVELFQAGISQTQLNSIYAGTAIAIAARLFPEAITDIVTTTGASLTNWKDLAAGRAKLLLKKGRGAVTESSALSKFTKASGNGIGGGSLAAKGGGAGGAGLSILASLVQLGANLALNIATVNVLDDRIEAEARGAQVQIDAVNSSMIRLFDKQGGDINAVINQLDINQQVANNNKLQIEQANFEIREANLINSQLFSQLDVFNQEIIEGRTRYNNLVTEINQYNADSEEIINDLRTQAEGFKTQLDAAEIIIQEQKNTITSVEDRLTKLEEKAQNLIDRIEQLELQHRDLKQEFEDLKIELEGDLDITNDRITSLEGKIAKTQKFVKLNRGGSGSAGAASGAADSQTGILELANNLAGNPIQVPTMTNTDVYNGSQRFKDILEDLLPQINTETMTPEQIENFRRDIGQDFDVKLNDFASIALIPRLDDLQRQTSPNALRRATEAGVCNSLNGGSCPATPGNPNPTQGLGGLRDFLSGKMDAINASLNATAVAQNSAIMTVVQSTNDAVKHATFGLEAAHKFASTAWKVTRADKIMNGISMVLTAHNAMMLSNNLLSTLSEATNVSLEALGIRDETDKPLDFGGAVRGKIQEILTSILGAEQYAALTARTAKANRIYQASINVLDTTRNLFDSAHSIAEIGIEHTGQIGNALRDAGVVAEDAYGHMIEKVSPQNKALRQVAKFREGAELVEDALNTVSSVSSEVIEIQDNFEQLREDKRDLISEIDLTKEEKELEREEVKEESRVRTDISRDDFDALAADGQ